MVTELKPLQFGAAAGILHGLVLFLWGLVAALTGYGSAAVTVIGSIVYGYAPTITGSLWGLVCGLAGGFIIGFVFAWLYNYLCAVVK